MSTFQTQLLTALQRLQKTLDALVQFNQPRAPNYRYPLRAYWRFEWETLEAHIIGRDSQGPTQLQWGGYTWTRRTAAGKFGRAIWFSRADGRNDDGDVCYIRLITFRDYADPEPMNRAVLEVRPRDDKGMPVADDRRWQGDKVKPAPSESTGVPSNTYRETSATHVATSSEPPTIDDASSPTLQEPRIKPTTADWLHHVRHCKATEPQLFDTLFLQAFPQWKETGKVAQVRGDIGRLDQFGASLMADALIAYYDHYRTVYPQHHDVALSHTTALAHAKKLATDRLIAKKKEV